MRAAFKSCMDLLKTLMMKLPKNKAISVMRAFRAGVAAVTAGVLLVVGAIMSGGIQGRQDDAHARKGGESLLAVDEKAVGL